MQAILAHPCPDTLTAGRYYDDDYLRATTGNGTYYGRINPETGKPFHAAIDIPPTIRGRIGQRVLAVFDGVARLRSFGVAYGKQVTIVASDGTGGFYAHLDSILVKEGQVVKAGQQIATLGNTGSQSVGAHLHFEWRRVWNDWNTTANPYAGLIAAAQAYLRGEWVKQDAFTTNREEDELRTAIEGSWGPRRDLYYVGKNENGLWHTKSDDAGLTWSKHERIGVQENRRILGFLSSKVEGSGPNQQDFRTIGLEGDIWQVSWNGTLPFGWKSLGGHVAL